MARLSTHLRMAFHDWMWSADKGIVHRDEPNLAQRLARRLPLYFSDPEAHDFPSNWDAAEPVHFGVRRPTTPLIEVNPPQRTWASGTTTVFIDPPPMARPDLRA